MANIPHRYMFLTNNNLNVIYFIDGISFYHIFLSKKSTQASMNQGYKLYSISKYTQAHTSLRKPFSFESSYNSENPYKNMIYCKMTGNVYCYLIGCKIWWFWGDLKPNNLLSYFLCMNTFLHKYFVLSIQHLKNMPFGTAIWIHQLNIKFYPYFFSLQLMDSSTFWLSVQYSFKHSDAKIQLQHSFLTLVSSLFDSDS